MTTTRVREPLDHLILSLPAGDASALSQATREEIEAAFGLPDSTHGNSASETAEWVIPHAPATSSPGVFVIRSIPEWNPPPGDVTSHVPGRVEYEYLSGSGPKHPGDVETLKKSFLSTALAGLAGVRSRAKYDGPALALAVRLARAFPDNFTVRVEEVQQHGGYRPLFHVHWENGTDADTVLTQAIKSLEETLRSRMYSVRMHRAGEHPPKQAV